MKDGMKSNNFQKFSEIVSVDLIATFGPSLSSLFSVAQLVKALYSTRLERDQIPEKHDIFF